MKHSLLCTCDKSFDVTVPDTIRLTAEVMNSIVDNSFMNYTCPFCAHVTATDFFCTLKNDSGEQLYFIPEPERFSFFNGTLNIPDNQPVVIGFPELKERILLLQHNLDYVAIESLKILICQKAAASMDCNRFDVMFHHIDGDILIFHIQGIKQDEVAVIKLPIAMYEDIKETLIKERHNPPYSLLFTKGYCSVKNIDFGD